MSQSIQDDFENLITNSIDFRKLENQLNHFNIFEAVGGVRAELRHSNFLSFLFDPLKPHNLDTKFLEQFLYCMSKEIDFSENETSIQQNEFQAMIFDISLNGIKNMLVSRERANIDILIEFETQPNNKNKTGKKYLIVIENKIDSTEGKNQLEKYKKFATDNYEEYIKTLIYLTPDGVTTFNSKSLGYISVGYSVVWAALKSILERFEDTLSQSILLTLTHYKTLLENHIIEEDPLIELSQKIYRKHKSSLDFIFRNIPDYQSDISMMIKKQISKKFAVSRSIKSRVNFVPISWAENIHLVEPFEGNWKEGFPFIQYEFAIEKTTLSFAIYLGPITNETLRTKAYNLLTEQKFLKGPNNYKPSGKYSGFKFLVLNKNISDISQLGINSDEIQDYIQKVFELIENHQQTIDTCVIEKLLK